MHPGTRLEQPSSERDGCMLRLWPDFNSYSTAEHHAVRGSCTKTCLGQPSVKVFWVCSKLLGDAASCHHVTFGNAPGRGAVHGLLLISRTAADSMYTRSTHSQLCDAHSSSGSGQQAACNGADLGTACGRGVCDASCVTTACGMSSCLSCWQCCPSGLGQPHSTTGLA